MRKLDRQIARRIDRFLHERIAAGDRRANGKSLHGPLGDLRRYRVGDDRVVAELRDAALIVLVIRIGHRRDVHR